MQRFTLILFTLIITSPAWAVGTPTPPADPVITTTQTQQQGQAQGQGQQLVSSPTVTASAPTQVSQQGAPVSVENAPVTTTTTETDYDSLFFGFGTTFATSLNECGMGAQGGGAGKNLAGFLGFTWIDHDCWMQKVGEAEQHIPTRALHYCASRKIRNAIAYDQPRGKIPRTRYCVDHYTAVWTSQLEGLKRRVNFLEHQVEYEKRACDTKIERCEAEVVK